MSKKIPGILAAMCLAWGIVAVYAMGEGSMEIGGDAISRQGDQWKDNSSFNSPKSPINGDLDSMSREGNAWKDGEKTRVIPSSTTIGGITNSGVKNR